MKKNYMMKLAAVLLVLVLLSTCVISGTFAKYVTKGSADDEARVAKWGVTIVATDDDEEKAVLDTLDNENEAEISVAKEKKLLAPGTKGGLVNVKVTGEPEVAVKVTVDFTIELASWVNEEAGTYCPLEFTAVIAGVTKTYKVGEGGYANEAGLIAALEADVEAASGNYAADTNLATTFDLVLSWSWAFNGDDVNDTKLGNLAVAPTLKVTYNITVEQID